MTATPRVAVVGGGIAGLAAAWQAHIQGAQVTLYEASSHLGGKIATGPFGGLDLDAGPDAFLNRVPWARQLCEEVGLGDELVAPATRHAYLWADGALRPFPTGMLLGVPTDLDALSASGLLSAAGVARVAEDLVRPADAPPAEDDETIGALVRRRLGAEALDRLIDPLLSGIFAGDTDRLSAAAAAPQLRAAAAADASLVAGARHVLARTQATTRPVAPGADAPVFLTVRGGLARLVDAIVDRVVGVSGVPGAAVRTGCPVHALQPGAHGGYLVVTPAGREHHDAVIVTAPAPVAAALLAPLAPEAATTLGAIDYASVVLVSFAYRAADVDRPLDGSGFLVPRSAGMVMTACSWSSSKWAHLGGDGTVRLRVSAGRDGDGRIAGLDNEDLVSALRLDLGTTMGITAAPAGVRVSPWPSSLPQYRPGHLARVAAVEADVADRSPGLAVTGAAFRGVGLPACIDQGRRAAAAIIERLG